MQRRDFIAVLGGTAAAGFSALAAHAQRSMRQRRIATAIPGWGEAVKTNPYHVAFIDELARLGFVEARNLVVDRYSIGGQIDSYTDLARSVAGSQPDVILTATI